MAGWDAVKVAEYLGISVASVRVYVMRGVIPPGKLENRKHFWNPKLVKILGKTRRMRGRPKKS
jgi:predicted site-specific integrase-resolvase